ncbi:MAG: type I methionyl aminopeptidase [Candidatus Eiseniibacteriota bacterium]
MIHLRSEEEVDLIRKSAQLVALCLDHLETLVRPGITTLDLDRAAETFVRDHGATPAFKGYRGYPRTLCVAVNETVVHGIPDGRVLAEGDLVGCDMGVVLEGFYGDSARTFPVGAIAPGAQKLLDVTREAMHRGIAQAVAGNRIGDIGHAIQTHVEDAGFSVVRDLVGHGIGRELHEEPQVPNYGKPGKGLKLSLGQVLAIEPMVNMGRPDVVTKGDGWTVVTKDGRLSAHFEHTIAVGREAPEILSTSPRSV